MKASTHLHDPCPLKFLLLFGIMSVYQMYKEEFKPFQYSVYYAKPNPIFMDLNLEATYRRKSKTVRIPYYKVTISTENGKVDLWPNEYMIISGIEEVTAEIGNSFDMIRMGGNANYDDISYNISSYKNDNCSDDSDNVCDNNNDDDNNTYYTQ